MTNSVAQLSVPPLLRPPHDVEFRDIAHLSYWVFNEIGLGRLSAIGGSGLALFSTLQLSIKCPALVRPVSFDAQVVHIEGDVVGFSLAEPQRILMAIENSLAEPLIPLSGGGEAEEVPAKNTVELETNSLLVEQPHHTSVDGMKQRLEEPTPKGGSSLSTSGQTATAVSSGSMADERHVAFGRLIPIRDLKGFTSAGSGKTLFKVFRGIASQSQRGRLTVITSTTPQTFSFDEEGRLVDYTGDLVGALKNEGLLNGIRCRHAERHEGTVSQLLRIRAAFDAAGKALPAGDIKANLQRVLVDRLDELSQSGSQYFLEDLEQTQGRLYAMEFVAYGRVWVDRWVRRTDVDAIDKPMNGRMHRFPVALSNGQLSAAALCANDAERRFVEKALGQGRVLRRLLTFSPLNRRATFRFLHVLEAFGLVDFQMDAPFFADGEDVEAYLNARVHEARTGYFAALGLHPSAHLGDIDRGFTHLQSAYGPSSKLRQHSPKAAELCEELCQLGQAAKSYLNDTAARKAYRRELLSPTERSGFASLLIDKMKLATMRSQQIESARLRQAAVELCPRTYRDEVMNVNQDEDDDGQGDHFEV